MIELAQGAALASEAADVRRIDGYLAIEHYAAIGDSRTLALVGIDGAIDWMCLPELDSPGVFGAILDPQRGGRFLLQPASPFTADRRYLEGSNVLETTFTTAEGRVRVTDALTIDQAQTADWRELIRRVEGLSGTVPMTWCCEPRFEFGERPARFECYGPALVARDGALQLALRTWEAGTSEAGGNAARGQFALEAGQQAMLALLAAEDQPLALPDREALESRMRGTVEVWRSWGARHCYDGPWRDAVERSLLALRLLADGRSRAIAAAGTTSLPEVLGGSRNYDYRFGWVRDLCFTLDAFLAVGMEDIAPASLAWLLRATRCTHPRVDPIYRLDGRVVRSQQSLALRGYRDSVPVHVGNGAGAQLQLGGFGDLMETAALYVRHGHLLPSGAGERLADIADLLTSIWRSRDAGLWELDERAHYGTSKLGCWVAFERVLELMEAGHVPRRHPHRWRTVRDQVRAFIETRLYSEGRNCYLMKAEAEDLDCGMLLAARRHFGDPAGKQLTGTIEAIRGELHADGPLFYRYSGVQDQENAFLACSFWMVEALALAGRLDEAAELMQGAVNLANDVGLYSEEMEPGTHAMRGNFPQALTHLGLIAAAAMLERCQGHGDDGQ